MIELYDDIWQMVETPLPELILITQTAATIKILIITTNLQTNVKGNAVMGRGIALEARKRFPRCDEVLGNHLRTDNREHYTQIAHKRDCDLIVCAVPTKDHWKNPSTPQLIERALQSIIRIEVDIVQMGLIPIFLIPELGCGNGGLSWPDVKPLFTKYLVSNQFIIVHPALAYASP